MSNKTCPKCGTSCYQQYAGGGFHGYFCQVCGQIEKPSEYLDRIERRLAEAEQARDNYKRHAEELVAEQATQRAAVAELVDWIRVAMFAKAVDELTAHALIARHGGGK